MRSRRTSWVVIVTASIFVGVHLGGALTGLPLRGVLALHPAELLSALASLRSGQAGPEEWAAVGRVWSHVLVHGDLVHLGHNLLFFWLFGTLLFQVAGERWVLASLLLTPLSAAAAFAWRHAGGPPIAVIGASGAISGTAGLYCLLAFRWELPRVQAWPLARPIPPAQAAVAALVAAALDIWVLGSGVPDGVARDAHLGGFAGGLLIGALLTSFFPTSETFRASRWGPADRRGS